MNGDDHIAVRRERRARRDGDGGCCRVGVLGERDSGWHRALRERDGGGDLLRAAHRDDLRGRAARLRRRGRAGEDVRLAREDDRERVREVYERYLTGSDYCHISLLSIV